MNTDLNLFFFLQSPAVKRGDISFSATSSEKIHKHAEFKKFEPIPSQEALDTMVPAEVSSRLPQSDGLDTHRRTLSLDYTIMVSWVDFGMHFSF